MMPELPELPFTYKISECGICDKDPRDGWLQACTHYGDQSVTIYKRPMGYLSVVRRRNGVEVEGHVGDPKSWEIYASQVEYIRSQ